MKFLHKIEIKTDNERNQELYKYLNENFDNLEWNHQSKVREEELDIDKECALINEKLERLEPKPDRVDDTTMDTEMTTNKELFVYLNDKFDNLEWNLQKQEFAREDIEDEIAKNITIDVDEQCAIINRKLDTLLNQKLSKTGSSTTNNNLIKPRCPVCYEEMGSKMKIAQCINGHFLCWPCKEKMGDETDCTSCGHPVNGRCFGMETYLKTVFGF